MMYELIKVGERTYYVDCPSKMGIYNYADDKVCMIDSGNDKDAAKKALRHIEENGWKLEFVINTHSHADHIGGNAFLAEKTDCKLYAPEKEVCFTENTVLEPALLYGGYPLPSLKNKFLMAKESVACKICELELPDGMEITHFPGHSFDMIAVKTGDDVWFVGDTVASEVTLQKYHISFMYDVNLYLESLEKLCELKGKLFIPSHASPCEDIMPLAEINKNKTREVMRLICSMCGDGKCFEDILKEVFDHYGLTLDVSQYALSGSTIRSYISYLTEKGGIESFVSDNKLMWKKK